MFVRINEEYRTKKKVKEEKQDEQELTEYQLILDTIKAREEKTQKQYRDLSKRLDDFDKALIGTLELLQVKMKKYEKCILEATEINENVEATLRNVFLAIRQNEYLQAYYPAQQGYPEMKVVGKHPAVLARQKK